MTQRQKQKVIGTETTSKLYDYTDTCVEYFCNIVYSRWDFTLSFMLSLLNLLAMPVTSSVNTQMLVFLLSQGRHNQRVLYCWTRSFLL